MMIKIPTFQLNTYNSSLDRHSSWHRILKKLGIDEVYCLSANDPFVMKAWAKNLDLKRVKMLPDANLEFTKAMEMLTDRSAAGMGQRSKRYSIYVKNKIIEKMFVDADGRFDVSDSNTMISFLKSQK